MPQFTSEDHAQIARIQVEVAKVLRPFAHNTEAGLAVMALIRNARVLIRRYPPELQSAMNEAIRMYLEGETPDEVVLPFNVTSPGGIILP